MVKEPAFYHNGCRSGNNISGRWKNLSKEGADMCSALYSVALASLLDSQ
ncbi:hypothetical protein NFI96_033998, partial [Prochilodus magdalenae]